MASLKTTIPFWTLFFLLFASLEAKEFVVGGNTCSWAVPSSPIGSLNEWTNTERFGVGDTLIFEYDPNYDSVMRVTEEAYKSCNTSRPIEKYKYNNGSTKVGLDRPGPLYFIGGDENSCKNGQKLTVDVMSDGVRHGKQSRTAAAQAPAFPVVPPPDTGVAYGSRGWLVSVLVGVGTLVGMLLL